MYIDYLYAIECGKDILGPWVIITIEWYVIIHASAKVNI